MKKCIFCLFAICMLVCCSKEISESTITDNEACQTITYTAYSEDENSDDGTKTSLSEDLRVLWNKGDEVAIFQGSTRKDRFRAQDDCAGKTSATLACISYGTGSGSALNSIVAAYPYDMVQSVSQSGSSYQVSFIMPEIQYYEKNSFGNNSFPMVAVTNATNDTDLSFRNVCGVLTLKLKGDGITVKNISVFADAPYKCLSGSFTVTCSASSTPSFSLGHSNRNSWVTLDCGEGVNLNVNKATEFNLSVLPQSISDAFFVLIETNIGPVAKCISKGITFNRNRQTAFAELTITGQSIFPSNKMIVYKTTDNKRWAWYDEDFQYSDNDFYGYNYGIFYSGRYSYSVPYTELNPYNYKPYFYFQNEGGEINKIKEIYLPNGLTTLGMNAFLDCYYLERVYLPSTITKIDYAFAQCRALKSLIIPECNSVISVSDIGINSTTNIYVPDDKVTEFKSKWSRYASQIFSMNEMPDGTVVDLSAAGTANCYIVPKAGQYQFNAAVKGNSTESIGSTPSTASVLWESFGTATAPNIGDLISNVTYSDGIISFTATNKKGNAVITLKNSSGAIIWSWHIWLTDTPSDQQYNNGAGIMMDRNLGATSNEAESVNALGLLYQWGRKDPFLNSSSVSGASMAASTITWPSSVQSDYSYGTIAYATEHPTTFITENTNNHDWYYIGGSKIDNTRWQANKGTYDPCPVGYRVPNGGNTGVWAKAFNASSSWTTSTGWNQTGMDFAITSKTLGTSSSIWYPAAGYIRGDNGKPIFDGTAGEYWSCTTNSPYVYFFRFTKDNKYIYPSSQYGYRPYGRSIRCVKE